MPLVLLEQLPVFIHNTFLLGGADTSRESKPREIWVRGYSWEIYNFFVIARNSNKSLEVCQRYVKKG